MTTSNSIISIRNELADLAALVMAVQIVFSVLASIARISEIGLHPIMYLHVINLALIIGLYFLREHIPLKLKTHLLCGISFTAGAFGLHYFGLIGGGVIILLFCCLLSTLLLSTKEMMIYQTAVILVFCSQIGLAASGNLEYSFSANNYMISTSAWIGELTLVVLVVSCSTILIRRILQTLTQNGH